MPATAVVYSREIALYALPQLGAFVVSKRLLKPTRMFAGLDGGAD